MPNRFENVTVDESKALYKALKNECVLVPKNRLYHMLGGAIAFVVAAGIISYGAGLAALKENQSENALAAAKESARKAEVARSSAERDAAIIASMLRKSGLFDMPVGTIVAYSGSWPPALPLATVAKEEVIGWMLCNGRPMDKDSYPRLFAALGTIHGDGRFDASVDPKHPAATRGDFNLPDYRGYFLRGVDEHAIVDLGDRQYPPNGSGGIAQGVGTRQGFATARPQNAFRATSSKDTFGNVYGVQITGKDTVNKDDESKNEIDTRNGVSLDHSHYITEGGDNETRPINSAVHWIIRVDTRDN